MILENRFVKKNLRSLVRSSPSDEASYCFWYTSKIREAILDTISRDEEMPPKAYMKSLVVYCSCNEEADEPLVTCISFLISLQRV